MTKDRENGNTGQVSSAFNATRLMAEDGGHIPWRRATLMARADQEFRRLHGLKPATLA